MRLPLLPALLAALSLSACSTVPPSSYAKLASLSPLEANPAEIRMAVIAPEQLVIRPGGAILSVAWRPEKGDPRKKEFSLDVLSGNATAPQLIPRLNPGQRLYVLKLTDADSTALLALQREVRAAQASGVKGQGDIGAGLKDACWTGRFPTTNEAMPLEAHLRTEAGGGWTTLIAGIDLKDVLKSAGIGQLPSCP